MQKNLDYLLAKGPMMVLENIGKIQDKVVKILDNTLNMDLRSCLTDTDFTPASDFYNDKGGYTVEVDLPGVNIKDVEITFHHDTLIVSGVRKGDKKAAAKAKADEADETHDDVEDEETDRYIDKEINRGTFERSFSVTCEIDESKIKASYKDGVLSIKIPKVKETKLKKVKIEIDAHKK